MCQICNVICFSTMRVYSSAVERLTADQQVPGSNPGAPFANFLNAPIALRRQDTKRIQKVNIRTGHSSVGRAFDCRFSWYRMVPGSIPGVRSLYQFLRFPIYVMKLAFASLESVRVRDSIVVSISACHADDPGSIPGRGVFKCFV